MVIICKNTKKKYWNLPKIFLLIFRNWHPPQSHYEADSRLTSFIFLACGLSSNFATWVVWSSDCAPPCHGGGSQVPIYTPG